MFAPAQPMPGVIPKGQKPAVAMDAAPISEYVNWSANNYYMSAFAEGTTFLGYAYLAALSQRAEYRVVSETIAAEAMRAWISIKSSGDDKGKAEKISEIEAEFNILKVKEVITTAIEHDGFFGKGHIYLDTGDTDDREELITSLGDGCDKTSRSKVSKEKPLRAIRTVEPVWTYPSQYNTNDPLHEDWYRPETWYVNGKEIHRTRFLTIVGRPVSDMLKPAYSFGGVAMSQMLKPYVDNWLRTRQSVSDLVHSFAIPVLKTNLGVLAQMDGDALFRRADVFNNYRDNQSLMILDKDAEEFATVQTSLGGLDALQAQSQEQMAGVARLPLIKLFGIEPHGLNASSEGSFRALYDWLMAYNGRHVGPIIQTILNFVQLSLYNEVDEDIVFEFNPLWQLDDQAKAAVENMKAQTHAIYAGLGAVDDNEVRESLREDKSSLYASLDLDGDAPGPAMGTPEMGDPFAASEADAEDPAAEDHVDTWRRRAAALFADADDIAYWGQRAAEMFGDSVEPGRWAALAAKLAITSNQTEPTELWARRARRWAERAEELRTAAEIDEEARQFDDTLIRWDNPDNMGRHIAARDPVESHEWRDRANSIPHNVVEASE
jgi:phage-related protein (TIGR01555 family)